MKNFMMGALALATLGTGALACDKDDEDSAVAGERMEPLPADNTGVNERDLNENTITPIDQGQNSADIEITAMIRRRILDDNLSTNADNVKIVTENGIVTLRGPVASAAEKTTIEQFARQANGVRAVHNELEVATGEGEAGMGTNLDVERNDNLDNRDTTGMRGNTGTTGTGTGTMDNNTPSPTGSVTGTNVDDDTNTTQNRRNRRNRGTGANVGTATQPSSPIGSGTQGSGTSNLPSTPNTPTP